VYPVLLSIALSVVQVMDGQLQLTNQCANRALLKVDVRSATLWHCAQSVPTPLLLRIMMVQELVHHAQQIVEFAQLTVLASVTRATLATYSQ